MSYVIYNKETTVTLLAPAQSVGCYVYNYKTESAAKAALTRLDKKGMLGDKIETANVDLPNGLTKFGRTVTPYVKADFAIADAVEFQKNIEKTVTRINAMSGKEYQESINTPNCVSPASEAYWSM